MIGFGFAATLVQVSRRITDGEPETLLVEPRMASHIAVSRPRFQPSRGWASFDRAIGHNRYEQRVHSSQSVYDVETISPDQLPLILVPESTDDSDLAWLIQHELASSYENDKVVKETNQSEPEHGPSSRVAHANSSSKIEVMASSSAASKERGKSSQLPSLLVRASGQLLQIAGTKFLQRGTQFLSQKPKERLLALCDRVQPNGISATPSERKKIKSLVAKLASLNPTTKPALAFDKQRGIWRMLYTDWPSEQGQYGPFTGTIFQQVDPNIDDGTISRMLKIDSSVKLERELMAHQAVFDENTWRINFANLTTNLGGVVLPRQYFNMYDEVWLWRYLYVDNDLRVWRAFKLGGLQPGGDQDYIFVTVRG